MGMKRYFQDWTTSLAAALPLACFIQLARKACQIHLTSEEIRLIATTVKQKRPCRFLVFGFGNDSMLWVKMNHHGKTIFLEDIPLWFDQIMKQHPHYNGYLVTYETVRTQWQELLDSPEELSLALPPELQEQRFDCILVDGPHGWVDSDPGRMKSIYFASQHIAKDGDIFVHDCDRIIEKTYCDRYLSSAQRIEEAGRLRHYSFV